MVLIGDKGEPRSWEDVISGYYDWEQSVYGRVTTAIIKEEAIDWRDLDAVMITT